MQSLLSSITTAALTVLLLAGTLSGPVLANVPDDQQNSQSLIGLNDDQRVVNPALSGLQALALGTENIPPLPSPSKQRYKMVDAGGPTTCAIRAGNKGIDCFGFNQFGQAAPPNGAFKYISMGLYHGCALTDIGKMVCWGDPSAYPIPQDAKKRYSQISAGTDHTCARTARGELNCWGDNTFGELKVPPGQFIDVSAKSDHTCAIDKGHNLLCWGDKAFTSYGPFLGQYTDVSTGNLHACALRQSDKRAVCWGNNAFGQASPPPDEFISLTSGSFHTCGQRVDKTTVCWGNNQYGQSVSDGRRVAQIAAGGNKTCILEQGQRRLSCLGSFAFNDSLFTAKAKSSDLAQSGFAQPQASLDSWLSGGLDWFGSSLSDGVETFFSTDLNKVTKAVKFGNIGFGLASFLVSNLLAEEDPNEARFKEIQQQLAEIKVSLEQISQAMVFLQKEMSSANYMIAASWCDNAIQPLVAAELKMKDGQSFDGPVQAWRKLMSDYQVYLTKLEQDKKNNLPTNPDAINQLLAKVDSFKATWMSNDPTKTNLERMRKELTAMILGGTSTSPLVACKAKSYQGWKSSPNLYPFDDRPIWQEAYKVFIKTMVIQDQIADIETGLNSFEMIRVFQGPKQDANGQPIPIFTWEPKEGEKGVCQLAQTSYYTGAANQRLKDAWMVGTQKGPCQKHPDIVRDIYLGQVRQFEYMGSAYSDDNVVLSMTSSQMGRPTTDTNSSQSNWLWFRRADLVQVREWYSDMPNDPSATWRKISRYTSSTGSTFINLLPSTIDGKNDYRLYLSPNSINGSDYGEFVWHSSGKAWKNVFQAREDVKAARASEKDLHEDFMESMAALKDTVKTGQPAFTDISKKAFWVLDDDGAVTNKTFDMRLKSFEIFGYGEEFYHRKSTLPCFVAENINDGRNANGTGMDGHSWYHPKKQDGGYDRGKREYLKLSGKVCNPEEFAALLTTNTSLGWHHGVDCRDKEECWGLSNDKYSFIGHNPKFNQYRFALVGGLYDLLYQNERSSDWRDRQWGVDETRNKMYLYHLPVVKITGMKCNTQIFADNVEGIWTGSGASPNFSPRSANREVGDGSTTVPSMCGNDLDRLINRYVPKSPYIDMPGMRNISVE